MHSRALLSLTLLAAASVGCHTASQPGSATPSPESAAMPPAASRTPEQPRFSHDNRALKSRPGVFDFYLLTMSWSPEYCLSNPGSPECAAHPGFVVHGMWPQNNNGSYPENCSNAPGPSNPASYLDVLPTLQLIQHEWTTHGTCSGLDANSYFNAIRTAFKAVKIPGPFQADKTQQSLAPAVIISEFASANPVYPRTSFAVSCGNNALTAMQVCLSKSLVAEACQNVNTCKATTVKIPPQ